MSDKIVVTASTTAGQPDTAAVTTATFGDVIGTLVSPSEAVTGMYKYLQLGLAFAGGFMTSNKLHGNGLFSIRS